MCVLIFSTTFVLHIFHSEKNSARYCHKFTQVFPKNTRYPCQILIKLEFSRQIFEKYSNIKFGENPSNGSRVVPCGRKDRHDEANSRFSQFCERALKAAILHVPLPLQAINTTRLTSSKSKKYRSAQSMLSLNPGYFSLVLIDLPAGLQKSSSL
jgi:hypothetical protein